MNYLLSLKLIVTELASQKALAFRKARPKCFEPHWIKDEECFEFFDKLRIPDSSLTSKKKHGNFSFNVKRVRQKLDNLSTHLACELERLLFLEEECWKISSRANWLMEGNRNTTYFNQKASQRHRRNTIRSIKDSNGTTITDSTGIENAVLHYFQSIYTSNNSSCTLQDGNGFSTKILHNKWIPFLIGFSLSPYFLSRRSERNVIDLIDFNQCCWRNDKVRHLFLNHEAKAILQILLNPAWPSDKLICILPPTGCRTGLNYLRSSQQSEKTSNYSPNTFLIPYINSKFNLNSDVPLASCPEHSPHRHESFKKRCS
ncbi:hypothetical protein M9H77_22214 [Catharanthus roseus]|uniref:Uncharacterized protein n=1 Tax=Catharanthus roseus TaxID=4058 RepID=A0ACC0AQ88_CATRO|nr:hypothetical protein M9H77_22214 [Catharanthus roseus]